VGQRAKVAGGGGKQSVGHRAALLQDRDTGTDQLFFPDRVLVRGGLGFEQAVAVGEDAAVGAEQADVLAVALGNRHVEEVAAQARPAPDQFDVVEEEDDDREPAEVFREPFDAAAAAGQALFPAVEADFPGPARVVAARNDEHVPAEAEQLRVRAAPERPADREVVNCLEQVGLAGGVRAEEVVGAGRELDRDRFEVAESAQVQAGKGHGSI
jgi:hypothetical protein